MRLTREELHRIFRRHWNVVAGATGICVFLALLYILATTRLYRATARFTAEPAGARSADSPAEYAQTTNFLNTQRERLSSRSILALALADPDVKALKTFRNVPNRLSALRQSLDVEVGKRDDVISVSFDGPYPQEAPRIANAIVEAYRQYQARPRQSNTAEIIALYQTQIASIRKELDDTTGKMQEMERRYGALSPGGDSNSIMLHRLASLSQELTAAQFDAIKARSDLEEARKSLPAPGHDAVQADQEPMIVSADQEETLRAEMIQLESQLQELRQRYLPEYPAVQALQQRIAQVNRSYAAAAERRWSLVQKRQEELQKNYDEQQKLAIENSARAADYARLSADADHFRKSIDNVESRMQAIEVTRDTGGIDVDFLEPAQSAVQSQPHSAAALSTSLIFGLLLGVSLAMLREWMDDRLRSPQDARAAMGVRLLGAVPSLPSFVEAAVAARETALAPDSAVARAYRAIQADVLLSAPEDRCRTMVITSPGGGDGKTTSAVNLAIAMAQAGKRVLLIDAVLRDPMLDSIFELQQTSGLAALLSGQGAGADAAIQPTTIEGLWVLPGGQSPRSPVELLNSPAFPELLERLADQYDQVIIDAPAVLGDPDARIIAASCDLTLLVLRAELSTRRRSLLARGALAGVGAHLLGIIVTHAPAEETDTPGLMPGKKHRWSSEPAPDPLAEEDSVDLDAHPA